jgi:hypothetical protein
VESWGRATTPFSGPRLGSEGAVLSPHFMYLGQTRSPRSRYSTYIHIRSAEYGGVQSRCSIISLPNSTHVCLRPAEYVEQCTMSRVLSHSKRRDARQTGSTFHNNVVVRTPEMLHLRSAQVSQQKSIGEATAVVELQQVLIALCVVL